jgi:hypothetical protein
MSSARYKRFFYFLALSCLCLYILSCSKKNQSQNTPVPPSPLIFTGVASYISYYYNPKPDTIKMDSQLVYIARDTGTFNVNSYIYSTKTDKSGNFTFDGLDPSFSYIIFSHPMIVSSSEFTAPYIGKTTISSPYDTVNNYTVLAAIDSTKYNGINITTQDIYGGRIGKALVIIYKSKVIAQADTIFSGNGSLYQLTTDSLGKGLAAGLPSGPVYLNALLKIDSITSVRLLVDSLNLNTAGFLLAPLTLK